ncbi:hypothetical protein Taro_036595 [Colocasia esculenta]|uniref:Malectin-like domain-containing protein n=1 Tax=Colocasia esculenta TaxID=4460 RepID=A0A843WA88_COLES|nr:hypothetical protein [Colocasia esculenta]
MPLVISNVSNDIFLTLSGLRIRGWRSKGRILGGFWVSDSWVVTVPDTDYIDAGVNKNILSNLDNLATRYQTLRNFPEGIRNCYRLRPVRPGGKYLVRAAFYYGNYDGKNAIPVFDLHIGVTLWRTVDSLVGDDTFIEEIITVAPADSLFVCLVNTARGIPFISSLELRPLSESMYLLVNQSQSLVLIQRRRNYGASFQIRFPGDPYDRIWFNVSSGFQTLVANAKVQRNAGDEFEVPTSVLSTAVRTYNTSYYISSHITAVNARAGDRIYVVTHFAEIELLMPNESRKMDI